MNKLNKPDNEKHFETSAVAKFVLSNNELYINNRYNGKQIAIKFKGKKEFETSMEYKYFHSLMRS